VVVCVDVYTSSKLTEYDYPFSLIEEVDEEACQEGQEVNVSLELIK